MIISQNSIEIGIFTIHFYGLMYALAAVNAYFLTSFLAKKYNSKITKHEISDVVFYGMLGGVLGGRLFYVFVYNWSYFSNNLVDIFFVWNGGMSIHGGIIGGLLFIYIFCKFKNKNFLYVLDLFLPAIAIGLFFGRFGNFLNNELAGRVTDLPWGIVYDYIDSNIRHPWAIYAMIKNIFLFCIIYFLYSFPNIRSKFGFSAGIFAMVFAFLRFILEFFRMPDPQIGFLKFGLSMGQVLSFFLFFFGVFILFFSIYLSKKK